MSPHLVYYQLVPLVLLWLCVMLLSLWPSPPAGAPKTSIKSITPKGKRATEPKAFEGLTQKPHCALCEQETGETAPAPPTARSHAANEPPPPDSGYFHALLSPHCL
jgi:hypothetical protein